MAGEMHVMVSTSVDEWLSKLSGCIVPSIRHL